MAVGFCIGLLVAATFLVWMLPTARRHLGPAGDLLDVLDAWWTLNVRKRAVTMWVENIAGVRLIAAFALARWGLQVLSFRRQLRPVREWDRALEG